MPVGRPLSIELACASKNDGPCLAFLRFRFSCHHDSISMHFHGNEERALAEIPFEFSWGTRCTLSISNKRKLQMGSHRWKNSILSQTDHKENSSARWEKNFGIWVPIEKIRVLGSACARLNKGTVPKLLDHPRIEWRTWEIYVSVNWGHFCHLCH